MLSQALETRRRAYAEDDWRVGATKSLLGASLISLGRYDEAEPLLLDASKVLKDIPGPQGREAAATRARLAALVRRLGPARAGRTVPAASLRGRGTTLQGRFTGTTLKGRTHNTCRLFPSVSDLPGRGRFPSRSRLQEKSMTNHRSFVVRALAVSAIVWATVGTAQAQGVLSPERTQGLVAPAVQDTVYELVRIEGLGRFVSAQLTKQGGSNDLTFVSLDIDGKNVVNISIAALRNIGLTQDNPYGLTIFSPSQDMSTVTIGFDVPLVFRRELKLSVDVRESGVDQILANVIHGK